MNCGLLSRSKETTILGQDAAPSSGATRPHEALAPACTTTTTQVAPLPTRLTASRSGGGGYLTYSPMRAEQLMIAAAKGGGGGGSEDAYSIADPTDTDEENQSLMAGDGRLFGGNNVGGVGSYGRRLHQYPSIQINPNFV